MKGVIVYENAFNEFEKELLINKPDLTLMEILINIPIGTIILNENHEIVFINEAMKRYYENDFELSYAAFGNIFKCEHVLLEGGVCGSVNQCKNCRLKNSVIFCNNNSCGVCSFRFGRKFKIRNVLTEK